MSNTKLVILAGLGLLLLAASIAGTWHYAQRSRDLQDSLQPIAALLEADRKIFNDLKTEGMLGSDADLLETYLASIRKDGAAKHATTTHAIDALANNNIAIVTLLERYVPRARTPAFQAAAGQFRDYATEFRDRWQSVFETFMAGGNLPAASAAFPTSFAAALAAERSALE